jgi:V8-like Glu-specific endopeptidase
MTTSKDYLVTITGQLKTCDYKATEQTCKDLIKDLYCSDEEFETGSAEKIMQQLRNKRLFQFMQDVGNVLIQTGRQSYKIRRLYAQSLIDQNNLTAALAILKELVTDTSNAPAGNKVAKFENTEARGLSGRVYKQLYVNAECPGVIQNVGFIKEAVKFYLDVYVSDPTDRTWHGINAVALLKRATADHIELAGFPPADDLAKTVLQTIEDKNEIQKADAWDFATAAEACVALNKPSEALEWMSGYTRMPYCDAFELASTLRQFRELWRLDMNSECGMLLLPLLRAELIKREGGQITLTPVEFQQQNALEENISAKYKALIGTTDDSGEDVKLQKVFGDDSFQTYTQYMKGADRCLAVARIGSDSSTGTGTGFLIRGNTLDESLGEELFVITNNHVVSKDPAVKKALRPSEAIIIFEALNNALNRKEEFLGFDIIWSSPKDDLDASIIRLTKESQERLKEFTKGIEIFPVSEISPDLNSISSSRIYIIGYPRGGTLRISYENNILLDFEDPKIHYSTATEGGSSGSPVFNKRWELIGLHHAGSDEMPRLNKKPGTYQANEGIWIQRIINNYRQSLPMKNT